MTLKEIITKWYKESFKGRSELGSVYFHVEDNILQLYTS